MWGLSRIRGLLVVTMAAATITGEEDRLKDKGACFIQIQERHIVLASCFTARLLEKNRQKEFILQQLVKAYLLAATQIDQLPN